MIAMWGAKSFRTMQKLLGPFSGRSLRGSQNIRMAKQLKPIEGHIAQINAPRFAEDRSMWVMMRLERGWSMIPYWSRRWGCLRGILGKRWRKVYKSYLLTAPTSVRYENRVLRILLGIVKKELISDHLESVQRHLWFLGLLI